MLLNGALTLTFLAIGLASPLVPRSNPPANAVFILCEEGTNDPICLRIKRPSEDVITEITHPNGTVEVKKNLYTRAQRKAFREKNNVVSVEHLPNPVNGSSASVNLKTKREPPAGQCWDETQTWYDTQNRGYWFQSWKQVGTCFYCDNCSEAISKSFSVAQTWTYGLKGTFDKVIEGTFSFSWGETFTLSETRTCNWKNVQNGCHSIWYQPLMSYHNGYANYHTITRCTEPYEQYYWNHHWAFANVNQAIKGANQGSLGCDSGCSGRDYRQCHNANDGGSLWPYAN